MTTGSLEVTYNHTDESRLPDELVEGAAVVMDLHGRGITQQVAGWRLPAGHGHGLPCQHGLHEARPVHGGEPRLPGDARRGLPDTSHKPCWIRSRTGLNPAETEHRLL